MGSEGVPGRSGLAELYVRSAPAGFRLAYLTRDRALAEDLVSIYVLDIDGSNLTRVTAGTGEDGDWRPMFSPDGTRIAFVRNGAVEVADADGGGVRELVGPEAGRGT